VSYRTAIFHFFDALNDFLPVQQQDQDFAIEFQGDQSVKHLFESCGVPHTEVGQVQANATPVSQRYIVQDGDRLEVYPLNPPAQPAEMRFVLDNHLGKLAAYLRLLGFDSVYRNDLQDDELAKIASQEARILLTRDVHLLMRSIITQGYWVRSKQPRQQVAEILKRYNLYTALTPFGRCVHCNTPLESVPKEQVLDRLEPLTRRYFDQFQRCPACGRVYWQGSHYSRMQEFIEQLRRQGSAGT
jgi:uncharacterized protein